MIEPVAPTLDLLVGPNGAGKTTIFEKVIHPEYPGLPFVNADMIAAYKFPGREQEHAYEAAEIAANTRDVMIDSGISFCTETVFSHVSKLDFVKESTKAGYLINLHIMMVSLETSIERVKIRVSKGGHDVPHEKLITRYDRLWPIVTSALPLCHRSFIYENNTPQGAQLIAAASYGVLIHDSEMPAWTPEPIKGWMDTARRVPG